MSEIDQPDTAEVDALLDLQRSAGYGLLVDRVREEIERRRNELEADLNEKQSAFARGYIAALRTVLDIPEILQDEIQSALKEK